LLFAEQVLDILSQYPAGVKNQRPDADYENGQRGYGDSRLERLLRKDFPEHARIFPSVA
jgi:hypothetical protein